MFLGPSAPNIMFVPFRRQLQDSDLLNVLHLKAVTQTSWNLVHWSEKQNGCQIIRHDDRWNNFTVINSSTHSYLKKKNITQQEAKRNHFSVLMKMTKKKKKKITSCFDFWFFFFKKKEKQNDSQAKPFNPSQLLQCWTRMFLKVWSWYMFEFPVKRMRKMSSTPESAISV